MGRELRMLEKMESESEWQVRMALLRRRMSRYLSTNERFTSGSFKLPIAPDNRT
jgi:hypothetical protein